MFNLITATITDWINHTLKKLFTFAPCGTTKRRFQLHNKIGFFITNTYMHDTYLGYPKL